MEFSTARKTIKGRTFSNYFISKLLSILPAQLTRCGIHQNTSILGIVEKKIISFCFRKEFFSQFYLPSKAITLLNLYSILLVKQLNFSAT